jgi:hypothetical protein
MFPKTAERSKPASKLQSRPESSAIPSSKNDSEGEAILDAASNAESEEVFLKVTKKGSWNLILLA